MADAVILFAPSTVQADVYAASHFLAGDAFGYLEHDGRRVLVVSDFEAGRARAESGADDVWTYDELGLERLLDEGRSRDEAELEVLCAAVARAGIRSALVPPWFPLAAADRLRAAGVELRPDASPFQERRRRKQAGEVEAIGDAQRAAEDGLARIRALLAAAEPQADGSLALDGEPLTSERLQGAVRAGWAERGYEGEVPIVACGPLSAEPHEIGTGPVRVGQPIICDLFPRHAVGRYHGDVTRTFCVGEPPAELVELHAAVEDALREALRLTGPGVPGAELNRKVSEVLHSLGYETVLHPAPQGAPRRAAFTHGLGHGVGLDLHEPPWVGAGGRDPLRVGDVLTLEPALYRPGFGGVRIEDLVVIDEDGCRNLTSFPYDLQV